MKPLSYLFFALMMSLIVILQSGCKDEPDNNPLPDVTASSDTIRGTVKYKIAETNGISLVDWHFGPAMVRATVNGKSIATAALSSNGSFELILPATVSGNYFMRMNDYAQTLGGSIKISPETLSFVGPVNFVVDYSVAGEAKNMDIKLTKFVLANNKPVVNRFYMFQFYDQDGSFAGFDFYGNSFNWNFSKGWEIIESYGSVISGSTTSNTVKSAAEDAVWAN